MADQGDMGGGSDTINCQKYPQYCNDDQPKSTDELLKMRDKDKDNDDKDCSRYRGSCLPTLSDEDWEDFTDFMLPAFPGAASKTEVFFEWVFFGGGVDGLTLITTSDGRYMLFYEYSERGQTFAVGPNASINASSGMVFNIQSPSEYEGPALSGAFNLPLVFGQGWKAQRGGVAWGIDGGISFGVSIPFTPSGSETFAKPIAGWSGQLNGSTLFVCRLLGECGR